jgi:hypothetical protein
MSHFHEAQTEADLPPSHQGDLIVDEPEDDREPDEPQPDYDSVKFEDTATYRDQMKDAGRGHLVR